MWGSGISVGWLALVLALYNLARWWSSRSRARRIAEAKESSRQRAPHCVSGQPSTNPDFRFTENQEAPN
jgi:hypothetical protein